MASASRTRDGSEMAPQAVEIAQNGLENAIRQFAVVGKQNRSLYLARALNLSVSRSAIRDPDPAPPEPADGRWSRGYIAHCRRTCLSQRAHIRASPHDRDALHIDSEADRRRRSQRELDRRLQA